MRRERVAQEPHELDASTGLLALRESGSSLITHPRCIQLPVPFSPREIGHLGDLHRQQRTDLLALARDIFRAQRSRRFLQELQQRPPIGLWEANYESSGDGSFEESI